MFIRILIACLVCTTALCVSTPSEAATYRYTGAVVDTTGLFTGLVPVGTPISGYMTFDSAAVQSGFVGEDDLITLAIQVGGFCVYIGTPDCNGTEAFLNGIDQIAISFDDAGNVTGGLIDAVWASPVEPYITWLFDFNSNIMFAEDGHSPSTLTADALITRAVPLPGALWLLSSGCLGLISWRCRTS